MHKATHHVYGESIISGFLNDEKHKKIGGMMRQSKSVYMVVLMIVMGLAVCSQAAEMKVGIIDFQEVVEKSQPGQKIEAELKKEGERMEAELTKDKDELTA
jgi:Skp family chaperone for outer membrane proteins